MADEKEIKGLIRDLGSYNRKVREKAVKALIKLGEPAYLMDALKDENVRSGVINALREISYEGEIDCSAAVLPLIDALKDDQVVRRRDAAEALVNIGDERAVPALIDTLKDEVWSVRWKAAEALGRIAEKTVEKGDYQAALKIIKELTLYIRKYYEGKKNGDSLRERRINLAVLSDLTQKIHDKMNPDKKKFPVKHQPVRRTQVRRVIRSG